MRDNIVQQDIQILNEQINKQANYFNKSPYYQGYYDEDNKLHTIIDEQSLYVNSGYGPETLAIINKQWKSKFPLSSFPNISIQNFTQIDIISFAYMYKNLQYPHIFDETKLDFNNFGLVKGFEANNMLQKLNIHPIKYEHKDRFIIMLDTKSSDDVIYLVKGYGLFQTQIPFSRTPTVIQQITSLRDQDIFICPCISFDEYLDSLKCFQEQGIINKTVPLGTTIKKTLQRVKFNMDEVGVSVEAIATIITTGSMMSTLSERRQFILDKSYQIILAKRGEKQPYF